MRDMQVTSVVHLTPQTHPKSQRCCPQRGSIKELFRVAVRQQGIIYSGSEALNYLFRHANIYLLRLQYSCQGFHFHFLFFFLLFRFHGRRRRKWMQDFGTLYSLSLSLYIYIFSLYLPPLSLSLSPFSSFFVLSLNMYRQDVCSTCFLRRALTRACIHFELKILTRTRCRLFQVSVAGDWNAWCSTS